MKERKKEKISQPRGNEIWSHIPSNWPKQITLSSGEMPNSSILRGGCYNKGMQFKHSKGKKELGKRSVEWIDYFLIAKRTVSSLWLATMAPMRLSLVLVFMSLMRVRHSSKVFSYMAVVAS